MRRARITTTTTLVMDALRWADDFMTGAQLCEVTGRASNQVFAALNHLRKYNVVDSIASDGTLWWFATGDDSRSRVIDEKVPESKPRRPRKPRRKL